MRTITLFIVVIAATIMANASAVTYTGVNGTMSDTVVFTLTGNALDVHLHNTGTGYVDMFSFLGPQLTPTALPAGWSYAYGPLLFSRTQAVSTLTAFIGPGAWGTFDFTAPAGLTLAQLGNQATGDGPRADYSGTPLWVEFYQPGFTPTPEPATLLMLGSGLLALAYRKARQ